MRRRHANQAVWSLAIIIISTVAGMIVAWRAPGLKLYARDRLMQLRGPLAPPDDLAIIAIDEASIARLGRFPWSRSLTANVLNHLAAAHPKAVALDILYSEPTIKGDDDQLASAIKQVGRVVVAAQLVEAAGGADARRVAWLRPLPQIEQAAAGIGHVNVLTESDGAARGVLLRQADDEGRALWAMAAETVRIADGVRAADVRELPQAVGIGSRILPVERDERTVVIAASEGSKQTETARANQMMIDYIGPAGAFARQSYSVADVLDGRISPEVFRDKYVLIGATAATLGERVASPFVHHESNDGDQHGALMPGVEVLANTINTILRGRFYRETPDPIAALCTMLVAAAALGLLAIAQGRFEAIKQLGALGGLLGFILVASFAVFAWWLIVPPLIPALVAFATAAPLGLLRRQLATSADLNIQITALQQAGTRLSPASGLASASLISSPAALIARLSGADGVAIFVRGETKARSFRLAAAHGLPVAQSLKPHHRRIPFVSLSPRHSIAEALVNDEAASTYFSSSDDGGVDPSRRARVLKLGDAHDPAGALVVAHPVEREPEREALRVCVEIATGYIAMMADEARQVEADQSAKEHWWPRGVEWKARALGVLNRRLLARARFVDRILRSVEDGLIVAGVDGRIALVNPRAAQIFGVPERALVGSDLFERIGDGEQTSFDDARMGRLKKETLVRLVVERGSVEREITIGEAPARYYLMRLSAVCEGDEGAGAVLGIVASLSDISKQRELQQMRNDVMALVTHELRTPLTAIQGMSEVLAQFDLEADRRREMHLAINDEAKRLARMIDEYLGLTRLESGARPLRLAPVRIVPLVERALLMLDPLAAQREIRVVRRFAPNLPALLADADLISQAVTNLVANAIKYSSPKTEVIVEVSADSDALQIEVADRGYGIPADAVGRVFEKFYRVPRLEDADVPGTGLGLALVREISERHGGRITVESEIGVGSTFSLRLPLSPR